MNASKASIMITLFFSSGQGKKHYTVTSINALRKNLNKFHRIKIKRRWTFQSLADLIAAGHIRRKMRFVRYGDGQITQIPSMLTFTLRGVVWLMSKGVKGAKELYRGMVSYLKKDDGRFPSRTDFDDGSWKPADPGMRKRLEGLLGIATKPIGQK